MISRTALRFAVDAETVSARPEAQPPVEQAARIWAHDCMACGAGAACGLGRVGHDPRAWFCGTHRADGGRWPRFHPPGAVICRAGRLWTDPSHKNPASKINFGTDQHAPWP